MNEAVAALVASPVYLGVRAWAEPLRASVRSLLPP